MFKWNKPPAKSLYELAKRQHIFHWMIALGLIGLVLVFWSK
jgi:hypothetical protein